MPSYSRNLRVLPNPYAAVDHLGRPAAAVLKDPVKHKGYVDNEKHPDPKKRWQPREFVGATRKSTRMAPDRTVVVGKYRKVITGAHDHAWEHSKTPVTVPNTPYYQRLVASGELLAADKQTWTDCGLDPRLFQEPAERLAHAKEGAVAQFIAHHGEEDERLLTLAMHWDGHVEQRHPVAKKLVEDKKAADAKAKAAAEPTAPAPAPAPAAPTPSPEPPPAAEPKDPPPAAKAAAPKGGN